MRQQGNNKMQTLYWPEDKDPSDMDYFEVKIDGPWVDTQVVSDINVSVTDGDGLQIGDYEAQAGVIRFQCGGGSAGTHKIVFTFTSQGRTLQRTVYLVVRDS